MYEETRGMDQHKPKTERKMMNTEEVPWTTQQRLPTGLSCIRGCKANLVTVITQDTASGQDILVVPLSLFITNGWAAATAAGCTRSDAFSTASQPDLSRRRVFHSFGCVSYFCRVTALLVNVVVGSSRHCFLGVVVG